MHAKEDADYGAGDNEQAQRQPDCDPFADSFFLGNIIDSRFCFMVSAFSELARSPLGAQLTVLVCLAQRPTGIVRIVIMPSSDRQ